MPHLYCIDRQYCCKILIEKEVPEHFCAFTHIFRGTGSFKVPHMEYTTVPFSNDILSGSYCRLETQSKDKGRTEQSYMNINLVIGRGWIYVSQSRKSHVLVAVGQMPSPKLKLIIARGVSWTSEGLGRMELSPAPRASRPLWS